MLTFKCPCCAFKRAYDPARPPNYCTRCGRPLPAGMEAVTRLSEEGTASHQPLLDQLLDQLLPFRSEVLVLYDAHLLAVWPVQLYTLDIELVVEDGYVTMMALARRELGPPPINIATESGPGPSRVRTMQVSQVTYQLMLLPIWVVFLELERDQRQAMVNGQTGEVILGALLPSHSPGD